MHAAAAKSLQSCPTLCHPIDGSLPGSPVPGILQARTLEWVAISFSGAWKWKVRVKSLSRVWLLETPWTAAYQAPPSMGFSKQEYWSGVPLPSPVHESEKWEWSRSVVPDSSRPRGLQPTRQVHSQCEKQKQNNLKSLLCAGVLSSPLGWDVPIKLRTSHMIKVWTVIPGPYLLLGSKYHLLAEIEISSL